MNDQTIFRAHRTERDRWTNVLNETVRDSRLSFRATGLLIYLLSLPPNWKASQAQIATCKTEGRDAVITAWNELRECGYITKELIREKGKIVATIWNIFETPDCRPTEKPETVQPETVQPVPENPTVRKTKSKETPKKESSIKSKVEAETEVKLPPELDTDDFITAWDEWVLFRRERRIKAYTVRGANAQLAMLSVWGAERAILAIRNSIARNYQGIYEEGKNGTNGNSNGSGNRNAGTFNEGTASQYKGVERLA